MTAPLGLVNPSIATFHWSSPHLHRFGNFDCADIEKRTTLRDFERRIHVVGEHDRKSG
jgi:hypothetical protein